MSIKKVLASIDAIQEWQEKTYKDLHQHPELSMQEEQTAQFIYDTLVSYGYHTQKIGGGVVGVMNNGKGPTVLFRADIDALPVKEETGLDYASKVMMKDLNGHLVPVMHACGHDIHIVSGLGAAWALANNKQEWNGTYIALFQPGEEIATGAQSMLDDGLLDKIPHPKVALAQHVLTTPYSGQVGTLAGPFLSRSASLKITIHGKGGHASMPHLSIDPIVIGAAIVTRIQTIVAREIDPFKFAVVTVGAFHSGYKPNIIPNTATLLLNIRTYDEDSQDQIIAAIERISKAECMAGGCEQDPDIEVYDLCPLTNNDSKVTEQITASFNTYLGEDRVAKHYHPVTASEDFSHIPRALGIPYLYWGIGGFTEDQTIYANHNAKFAPAIQPTLKTGTEAAIVAVLTYLGNNE